MKMETVNTKFVLSMDEILPYVGEFGRFQKMLSGVFFIIFTSTSYPLFIMYFSTIVPPWKCVHNASKCLFNGTLTNDDNSRCNIPRDEWYYVEPKEFSLVTQFDIHCNEEWILHLITSIFFVGWGIGAIILGWMGDRYGRKILLFPSISIILMVGFISSFLPNIYLIMVSRFIMGFFYPGVCMAGFILLSELVGNEQRPLATLIPAFAFPTGSMILALKAYLLKNWKILSIVCTAPYIFVLAFYTFIPESVRWCQLNGRHDEAMYILRKIGHWNKKELPSNITISSPEAIITHKSNPLDIFRTRKVALQCSIQIFIWLFMALSFYGLQLASSDLEGSLYKDFALLCIVEYPSTCMALIACKRFGRKKAALIPLLFGGATSLGIAFIPEEGKLKIARIILGTLGKFFISATLNVFYIWSAEIFPTDVRSSALGILQVSARVGSASSPWVVSVLKPYGMWISFTVMGITTMIGSVLGMWLPETINVLMKESVKQSENEIAYSKKDDGEELNVVMG